jgi:uncharacterized protein (TIGR02145 family)
MKTAPFFCIVLSSVLLFHCNLEEIPSLDPCENFSARFLPSQNACESPCSVTFTNESGASTAVYRWDFGNGQLSNQANPGAINYSMPGEYQVMLIASTQEGCSDTASAMIRISPPPLILSACFSFSFVDMDTIAPATVAFDGSCSENALSYHWDFGDPSSDADTSDQEMPDYRYEVPGNYQVTLQITGNGNPDEIKKTVTVREWQCGDPLVDPRDNQVYKTVWIDEDGSHDLNKPGQCWMAENLNYSAGGELSFCFKNQPENCDTLGRFYDLFVVNTVIPKGWRLTTSKDWSDLLEIYGFISLASGEDQLFAGNMDILQPGGAAGIDLLLGGLMYRDINPVDEPKTRFWVLAGESGPGWDELFFDQSGAILDVENSFISYNHIRCIKE